jgi:serine phosphatase RsbU (regulator of sigma subunit)
MGHGLQASRMANLAVGTLRNGRRAGKDLVELIRSIDHQIEDQFGDAYFSTALLATLDTNTGRIRAVNAGHPLPIVFHADGGYDELPTSRCPPLGLGVEPPEPDEYQLQPGDIVLFHTDGMDEARSTDGAFFGLTRLYDTVRHLIDTGVRLPEVLRLVVAELLAHSPDLGDDATAVLVGWQLGPTALPPATRALSTGPE